MAVGDIYRLGCIWRKSLDLPVCVNNFVYRQENALVLDTPEEDLFEAFIAKVVPSYRAIVTNVISLSRMTLGQSPDFAVFAERDGLTFSGTGSGDALPPRTSGVITLKTATISRRGRGRWFMPPAAEAGSGGGIMSTGHAEASDTFADAALNEMLDGGLAYASWQLCVWSEADQVARPVTSYVIRTHWSSQSDRGELY